MTMITELNQIPPPPNEDELLNIIQEEIETAVKRLRKHKSPGIDDNAGDLIQAGSEKVIEDLHAVCNQI